MQVIAFPPTPLTPDDELQQFERALVTLSSRFARVNAEEIGPAIVGALEQVAQALRVDAAALVEFADGPRVSHVHVWPSSVPADDLHPSPGMIESLLRNGVLKKNLVPTLAVPVIVAGDAICALIVRANLASRRWSDPAVERLRLLAEILGVAMLRCRQEAALRASLATIERLNARLEADNVYLKEEIKTYHDFDEIVGESGALRMALTRLGQVAPMNASVLLLGETGTGKELFARAVHDRSRRSARALVRVNCAALPPTLVESELFGHEKGAFTGAVTMRQGRFELADGGTIFLDEIGDLSAEIQAKLLRVLQEGEFERVGSSRTRKVDVRVIAATHRDLEADVASGRFRADLYYRLSVFPIALPALRERREDIPRLAWFFIHRHQRDLGRRIAKVPQDVMQALQQHAWPGNVRELENVIERAMIRSAGDTLELDEALGRRTTGAHTTSSEMLDDIQRAHIESVLAASGWKVNGARNAAERLGIHPNTLRFRMKKLGIIAPCRDHSARLSTD
jgi:formate hydrogenlyase transcriptional activator